MVFKPITDMETWTDAKQIINAHLHQAPYWSGESKELVMTVSYATASVWWEEVIAFYCKLLVSDLFVEGKGFKMILHIDHHSSGTVDSLGYIFDLIDIKQRDCCDLNYVQPKYLVTKPASATATEYST